MADAGASLRRGGSTANITIADQTLSIIPADNGESYVYESSSLTAAASNSSQINDSIATAPQSILTPAVSIDSVSDPCSNTPIGIPELTTIYYKLRAWDATCSPTPQSVTWVDTVATLANAPAAPCGGSLTNLTIVSQWSIVS